MHINQQARLAANQLRQRKPNQADRNRIAGILEEIATQFEEMNSKPESVETTFPHDLDDPQNDLEEQAQEDAT